VVGCWRGYLSGARCRLAYGPADASATHCLLLQYSPVGFTILVPAHPGSPRQRSVKRVCVYDQFIEVLAGRRMKMTCWHDNTDCRFKKPRDASSSLLIYYAKSTNTESVWSVIFCCLRLSGLHSLIIVQEGYYRLIIGCFCVIGCFICFIVCVARKPSG